MLHSSVSDLQYWKTRHIKKELNQCLFKVGYMPHPVIYQRVQVRKAAEREEEQYYLRGSSETESEQFLLKASLIHEEGDQSLLVVETFDQRSEQHRYSPLS